MNNAITDVAGIRVGHYTNREDATGCTVVLCEEGAVAGADVRGAAPGTRETDLLRPGRLVGRVNAILLTGGSAFGLEAAGGVMRYLAERGHGYDTGIARVPIVPAAVIFDLGLGTPRAYPTADAAYQACLAATGGAVAEGSVGAGTGATVGHALGVGLSTKGGLGTCSQRLPSGAVVAALMVVNAVGDVVDPRSGRIVAGARKPGGGFADSSELMKGGGSGSVRAGTNTVIGVVATDRPLSKEQANWVAQMAHDGLARAVRPSHTMFDGDTIFVISVPGVGAPERGPAAGVEPGAVTAVGVAAAEAVAEAILRAVTLAEGLFGIPSAGDLSTH